MANAQIFGVKNSQETRAAERFFKERGVAIHFVDLKQKPLAAAELRRFVERFGMSELIDRESKTYVENGMQYLRTGDGEWAGRIEREPKLLKLPLVRVGNQLAIGRDEAAWKAMLEAAS